MLNEFIKDLNSSSYRELVTIQKAQFIFGKFWLFRVLVYKDWTVFHLFPLIVALQAV